MCNAYYNIITLYSRQAFFEYFFIFSKSTRYCTFSVFLSFIQQIRLARLLLFYQLIALPGNVSILYQSGAFDDITLFNRQLEELYKFSRTPDHDPADIFYHCLHSRSDELYRPRSSNPMAVLLYANSLDEARAYLEHNFYELTEGKQLDEGFFQFSCSSAGRPLPDIEVYDVSAPENEDDEEEEPECEM